MIQSKSLGSKIFNVFNIILMSLLSLSCLYPLCIHSVFLFLIKQQQIQER